MAQKQRLSPVHAVKTLQEARRTDGEGLFIRECSDRLKGNGFKVKEHRFRSYVGKKFFHCEGGKKLEQNAQRSCGCPIPGNVQGQVG